jgi:hypothetical protein
MLSECIITNASGKGKKSLMRFLFIFIRAILRVGSEGARVLLSFDPQVSA